MGDGRADYLFFGLSPICLNGGSLRGAAQNVWELGSVKEIDGPPSDAEGELERVSGRPSRFSKSPE